MSDKIQYVMIAGGFVVFLMTLFMVRKREMREKYATAWILAAVAILGLGFMFKPIFMLAVALRVMPSAVVLMGVVGVIYLFAFSVTVSLSRHYKRNMRLAQEVALLEERIRQLETQLAVATDDK